MEKALNNTYFLLRHGKNIHQAEKKDTIYGYPDDDPPCELLPEGMEEAREAGDYLSDKGVTLIISSDTLRTRQTGEIVAGIIGYDKEIILDEGLRDNDWGIFNGKKKAELWDYYSNDKMKAFDEAPPKGESWSDCRSRIFKRFEEFEKNYSGEVILIVSHSNPLWLLDGALNGLSDEELLAGYDKIIKTGEVRKI